ncbi:MAG: hypothetical protein ABWX68_01305 [Arthrobacter sp.]|uniref:hypothetical protein n=1 Tax=Arthrobacter sp. TaxID=1667 RepID=UPI00346E794E
MDPRDPGTPPYGDALVSAAVVGELVETVGPEAALAFFERFAALWPVRRERLRGAIGRRDVTAGLDAALSLKSGACMAGAFTLAGAGDRLHALIGRGAAPTTATGLGPDAPWADAEALMAELDVLGERTVSALRGLAGDLRARTVEVPALGGPAPAVPLLAPTGVLPRSLGRAS